MIKDVKDRDTKERVRKDNPAAKKEEAVMEKKPKEKETGVPTGVNVEDLTVIREGEDMFQSYGYSYVKVTRNGKISAVKIPIRSSGVTELIEEWKEQEPVPPVKDYLIKKDSDQGRQMKLTENRWVKMPDLGDPEYVKAAGKYESNLGIAILQKGLALDILDKEGNKIENPEQKINVLKSMGLSGPQFTQMVQDIRSMTEWDEVELVNFFGMSSPMMSE